MNRLRGWFKEATDKGKANYNLVLNKMKEHRVFSDDKEFDATMDL